MGESRLPPPSIRRAVESEASALTALHVRAWQWAYHGLMPDAYLEELPKQLARREAMWHQQLHGGTGTTVFAAERGERMIGFCSTAHLDGGEPDLAELVTIYLEPDAVGTGVGGFLMRDALADLRARGYRAAILWVLDTNQRARGFYEKVGWRPDGESRTMEAWGTTVREVRYRIDLA